MLHAIKLVTTLIFVLYNTIRRIMEAALRHYEAVKKATSKYYLGHKQEISERRKMQYKQKNPNPKPRGRPKKNINVDSNNNNATELSEE